MTDEEKRRGLQKGYYNEATELMADEQGADYAHPNHGGDSVAADGTQEGEETIVSGVAGTDGTKRTEGFSGSTNGELLEYLKQQIEATKPESKEERQRRERLERTQNIAYGIADLGRALANMHYTTQYAPNGYDEKSSMSAKQRERLERAEKARKAKRDEWLNYALTKNKIEDNERSFNYQQERDKAAASEKARQFDETMKWRKDEQKRKDAELELKNAMFNWKQEFESGKLDVAKLNAQIRQMAEQNKQSRANINHNLSSWKRTKSYILDDRGKKIGEVEERIVINPNTGELGLQENNVTYNSGGAATATPANGGQPAQSGQTKDSPAQSGGMKKQNPMGGGKKKNPMN